MSEQPIKGIDLSLDNIQLTEPKNKNQGKGITQENKFLKKQNQVLRRQLENISTRLDSQIKKRFEESKKKTSSRSQEISQMELQNAYKKYQIYKRQAEQYKKKLQSFSEDKVQDYERRVNVYARQNFELKQQIKQLKKITKQQEKGLTEMGIQGYSSAVSQNEKLKEEIRILKKEVDNYRRALEKAKPHPLHFESRANNSNYERKPSAKRHAPDTKLEDKIKKRIKTQPESCQGNEQLTDLLHEKMEKDYHKLRVMAKEKNKLRQFVENLKFQLAEKEKENSLLKQKVIALRNNNQVLQNQVISCKHETDLNDSRVPKQNIQKYPKGLKGKPLPLSRSSAKQKKRVWKQEEEEKQEHSQISKNTSYPRKQERGSVMQNTMKWSHQHLSSKIKQIQVLSHENGFIKDIHVRYEKGQPKKYDHSSQKQKYSIFTCSEDQYIRNIEGAFYNGSLQYMIVTSNHRRVQKYGNYEQFQGNQQAQFFKFEVEQKEYPGALFGQTDEGGIRKLGCFIHKDV